MFVPSIDPLICVHTLVCTFTEFDFSSWEHKTVDVSVVWWSSSVNGSEERS